MRRFRFRLSALLVLTTAIALLLGYAEWRRLSITREYDSLKKEGVHFSEFKDEWWSTPPRMAVVIVEEDAPGRLLHNDKVYVVSEMQKRFEDWKSRAQGIGVGQVNLGVIQKNGIEMLVDPDEFWEDYRFESEWR